MMVYHWSRTFAKSRTVLRTVTGILNGVPSRAFSVFLARSTKPFFSHPMYFGISEVEFDRELGGFVVSEVDNGTAAVALTIGMSLVSFEPWPPG